MKISRIFFLLIVVSMLFLGCADSNPAMNHPAPPHLIKLNSAADIEDMAQLNNLSDVEIENFLTEKGYALSGNMHNREDLCRFLSPFQSFGYPAMDATSPNVVSGVTYYSEDQRHLLVYIIDGIRYSFEYTPFVEITDRTGMDIVATYVVDGETIYLYDGMECIVGELYTADLQIRIVVDGYANLEEIDFGHFTWKKV